MSFLRRSVSGIGELEEMAADFSSLFSRRNSFQPRSGNPAYEYLATYVSAKHKGKEEKYDDDTCNMSTESNESTMDMPAVNRN